MIHIAQLLVSASLALFFAPPAAPTHQDEEKVIRDAAAKYVEAYNRGDVDALVACYAKDATYDEGEGPVLVGSDQIRKAIADSLAANPGTKLSIDIKSIRFTKTRAIEIGVATLTPAKGDAVNVPYRAIHARQSDGKWLLTSVGPDVTAEGATSAGPLDELSWLLGSWHDAEANMNLSSVCRWDANHRFMVRTFVMKDQDRPTLEVTEIIGWDAADRVIRSWVFDSDGGFGQNTWSHRGDEWIISAKGTLADGGRASAVNIIRHIDDNTFTWSSTNRDVDGQMLPDVDDVKMIRDTEAQAATGGSK